MAHDYDAVQARIAEFKRLGDERRGEFPHDRPPHDTSSIALRRPLRWPDGARLAFAVVVSAEYYEMQPAPASFIPANVPGGFGRAPYPDFRAFSQRDYGNRVGVFRVIEALERFAVPATAAIDANVAKRYPYIVEQFRKRNFEIAGHGHAVTNVITNHMTEADERAYIASALDTLQRVGGARPIGWHGPEYGESERTPALLAELGINYVLDWPNDEQPFLMRTPSGTLVSLPWRWSSMTWSRCGIGASAASAGGRPSPMRSTNSSPTAPRAGAISSSMCIPG